MCKRLKSVSACETCLTVFAVYNKLFPQCSGETIFHIILFTNNSYFLSFDSDAVTMQNNIFTGVDMNQNNLLFCAHTTVCRHYLLWNFASVTKGKRVSVIYFLRLIQHTHVNKTKKISVTEMF